MSLFSDNLSSHKIPSAARTLREIGAWYLFLPPYSPDLIPIEMAFSKLKVLIRKAAARTYDDLWQGVGHVCDPFSEEECCNFFIAAGYEPNKLQQALKYPHMHDAIADRSENAVIPLRKYAHRGRP